MKRLLAIFFSMILLVLIIPAFAEDKLLSPKQQFQQGIPLSEIKCNKGLDFALKKSDGSPICVTLATLQILSQRNWITKDVALEPYLTQPDPVINSIETNPQNIVDSNNKFMLDFYSKTSKPDENSFFSPWSMLSAFSVLYEGARGQTADEIATVFYLSKDDSTRRDSFGSMQSNLNANGSGYELRNANALWIQTGFGVKQDFINTAKQFYDSKISEVNFPKDESIIDSWVEDKTNDKIKDLVKGRTTSDTRVVITNAVYFKGTWKTQFAPDQTYDGKFKIDEEKTVQVPIMRMESKFAYAEADDLQILSMPYEGDRISMLVLLPKNNIKSLDKSLTIENLDDWKSSLKEQEVLLSIPKFKLETKYELPETMKSMGMKLAFTDSSDLSGIAERNLFVSDAVHKAFVDVNEEGTEAAAATAIIIDEESEPSIPSFIADHPFIFLIQDNETGMILFMGKVVDPTMKQSS